MVLGWFPGLATHLPSGRGYGTACGTTGVNGRLTEETRLVSCQRCRRTRHFRDLRALSKKVLAPTLATR